MKYRVHVGSTGGSEGCRRNLEVSVRRGEGRRLSALILSKMPSNESKGFVEQSSVSCIAEIVDTSISVRNGSLRPVIRGQGRRM